MSRDVSRRSRDERRSRNAERRREGRANQWGFSCGAPSPPTAAAAATVGLVLAVVAFSSLLQLCHISLWRLNPGSPSSRLSARARSGCDAYFCFSQLSLLSKETAPVALSLLSSQSLESLPSAVSRHLSASTTRTTRACARPASRSHTLPSFSVQVTHCRPLTQGCVIRPG